MRLRFLAPVLGFSSLLFVACSGDDPSVTDGEGGGAGEASTPVGGGGGAGEASTPVGGGAGEGGGCTLESTGTLVIEVSGLPEDVDPEVIIEGPDELLVSEANDAIEGVTSGAYAVTASRVFDADPIVRTVFEATVAMPDFTLCDGASHSIKVSYKAIPSSNKLWMPTGLDEEGAGFASELLRDSGTTAASVSIDGGIGKSIAFDRDGNLWTLGPTLRFPAGIALPCFAARHVGRARAGCLVQRARGRVPPRHAQLGARRRGQPVAQRLR